MKTSGIYTKVKKFLRERCCGDSKQITVEAIREQIPSYLAQADKDKLANALEDFPHAFEYYTNRYPDEVLQGDGWNSFVVFDYATGNRKPAKGILLTNSCDVAPENTHEFPPNYTFAPIIKLNNYLTRFEGAGLTKQQIDSKVASIKEQRVSNIVYLPSGANLDDDYIALLGHIHTVPQNVFFESRADRQKLFTLSQNGFYLFIFKLSVHFCRLHENVERSVA